MLRKIICTNCDNHRKHINVLRGLNQSVPELHQVEGIVKICDLNASLSEAATTVMAAR